MHFVCSRLSLHPSKVFKLQWLYHLETRECTLWGLIALHKLYKLSLMILYMALMILMGFWLQIFKGGHRSEKIQARVMLADRTNGQDAERVKKLLYLLVALVIICFGLLVALARHWTCKCTILFILHS